MKKDIIIDVIAFVKSKVHPTIMEKIRQKMLSNPSQTRPKAKNKWQERVYLEKEGLWFTVICHGEGDKIVLKKFTQLRKRKPIKFIRR